MGGALEIYDFIIFVFFALTLSQLFFPPEMPEWLRLLQSFGIFVTGYLARPLGGILMAHFADRLGRKRVFSLSILMMALPCLLIGVMPTYAQIGYWAPLLLLGAEILDFAWRFPFLLGGVFGVIGVWLRRWLSETPVFMALQARREAGAELPLGAVLRDHRRSIVPAMLLTCVLTSAVVVLVVITPTVMQKSFGMSTSHTFALSSLGIVFLNIGCVLAGLLVDRIGAWRAVLLYSLLLPVGIGLLYACLITGGAWINLAYAVAGLACGVVGAVPSVMVGLFPVVSEPDSRVRHFVYLQYCLRALGEYHAVAADRPDALEPLGLRCLLPGDGDGRGADGTVFWRADRDERRFATLYRALNLDDHFKPTQRVSVTFFRKRG